MSAMPLLPKGLKKKFFGLVLVIMGLVSMGVTYLMYKQVDGIDFFFMAAGCVIYIIGALEHKKVTG